MVDIGIRVIGRWREAQPFCPFGHCGIIDRLHIDTKILHQNIRKLATFDGIFNHHGDDVAVIFQMWNTGAVKHRPQARDLALLRLSLAGGNFQMRDAGLCSRRDGGGQGSGEDEAAREIDQL